MRPITKSYVVELMQLANTKDTSEMDWNEDLFEHARSLLRKVQIDDFENVNPFLQTHGCDAQSIFGHEVTEETEDALIAYLCYVDTPVADKDRIDLPDYLQHPVSR